MRYVLAAVIAIGTLAACGGGQKSCDTVMREINERLDQYGRDMDFDPVAEYQREHGDDLERCDLAP